MVIIENMKAIDKVTQYANQNGGLILARDTEKIGISRTALCGLERSGHIVRVARGQYVLAEDLPDELLSLSRRSDYLVFSHETALFLHGLSDRTPFEHAVTLPSDKRPSAALGAECKIYYIHPELYDLGKIDLPTTMGNLVPAYDMERTMCDIVRSRNRTGAELLLPALRQYVRRADKNLSRLHAYADRMSVASVLRRYLEVLL